MTVGETATSRRRWVRRPPFMRVLLVLLMTDALVTVGYLILVQRVLDHHAPDGAEDVGIVFFQDFGSQGGLGTGSVRRVDRAATLYHRDRLQDLILVGGARPETGALGAERMAQALIERGVPAARLHVDRRSFDTTTNWHAARRYLDVGGWQRPVLISSPWHLLRIRWYAAETRALALVPTDAVLPSLRKRPLESLVDIHWEYLAWAARGLLPEGLYHGLLEQWRRQSARPTGATRAYRPPLGFDLTRDNSLNEAIRNA